MMDELPAALKDAWILASSVQEAALEKVVTDCVPVQRTLLGLLKENSFWVFPAITTSVLLQREVAMIEVEGTILKGLRAGPARP